MKRRFLIGTLLAFAVILAPITALAHGGGDDCGEKFTYNKSYDFSDNRVIINFSSSDEIITVTAKPGYTLYSVQLDVEGDGHSGLWTYPVVSGVAFNPPGGDIDSARVVVEKFCPPQYETCDVTIALPAVITWGPWSPWVYNPETGLETRFKDGQSVTVYVDSHDQQHECYRETIPLHQEESREVDYPDGALVASQVCEPVPGSWQYEVVVPEGAAYELIEGALSGVWADPYGPEDNAASLPTVLISWPSGYSEQVVGELITKGAECIRCRVSIMYPMTLYTDPNAPPVYWEGPFEMAACPVIHVDGEIPSASRVSTICSLCPDQFPEGFVFHGVAVDEGYVLKIECYGHPTRYEYLGYDWTDLVRFDFDNEGNRLSCRVEGCADWILEQVANEP